MKGITFYICIGRWGGIGIQINRHHISLNIGFLSIVVLFFDLEVFIKEVSEAIDDMENKK